MCWVSDPSLAVVIGSCKTRKQAIKFRNSLLFEIKLYNGTTKKQTRNKKTHNCSRKQPLQETHHTTPSRAIPLQRLHFYNITEALTKPSYHTVRCAVLHLYI